MTDADTGTTTGPVPAIWHINIGNHAGAVDGVAAMASRLASAQADLGRDVVFFATPSEAEVRLQLDALGPGVGHVVKPSVPRVVAGALRAMLGRTTRPGVVHFHSVYRPAHVLLFLAAKALGVVTVQSPHSGLAPERMEVDRVRKLVYGWVAERWIHRYADLVIALQRIEAQDVARYADRRRPVAVIPNAVADDVLEEPRWHSGSTSEDPPVAILLARFDVHQKGLDRLAELASATPEIKFQVYGSQDKNQPEATARLRRTAPPNLALCPPLHGRQKYDALRSARLFIMPSRVEGLSLALLEAMALGVPCVVSAYVDRSLEMTAQNLGVALNGDPGRDSELMRTLVDDDERLSVLGHAAAEAARSRFSAEVVAQQVIDAYGDARCESLQPTRGNGADPLTRSDV